jgi:hypothetical protein
VTFLLRFIAGVLHYDDWRHDGFLDGFLWDSARGKTVARCGKNQKSLRNFQEIPRSKTIKKIKNREPERLKERMTIAESTTRHNEKNHHKKNSNKNLDKKKFFIQKISSHTPMCRSCMKSRLCLTFFLVWL